MRIDDLILALTRGEDPNKIIPAQYGGGAFPPVQIPDVSPAPGVMSPAVSTALGASAANTNANLNATAAEEEAKAKAGGAIAAAQLPPTSPPLTPPIPTPRPRPEPPPASAPKGAETPVTNPTPPAATPRMMQSPPDLANMYVELIKKNQNAAALDSGASMIAAGFSKYPENRAALLAGAFNKSGQQNLTSQDIMNLHKLNLDNQALLIRQAAKKGLMGKYGLSVDDLDYLDASGKLDEVLKAHKTQALTQVTNAETGQVSLHHGITGEKITDVGGPKPEEGQYVQTPEGMQLRSKRAGGAAMGEPVGAEVKTQIVQTPEGQNLVDLSSGNIIARSIGGAPTPETEKFVRPDGSQFLRNKRDGKITEVVAPEKVSDKITDDDRLLAAINAEEKVLGEPLTTMKKLQTDIKRQGLNASDIDLKAKVDADRVAAGEKPTTWADYITKYKHQAGTTINVGPDGTAYPAPPQGQDYVRYPAGHKDAGKVMVGPDGKTVLYSLEGGKAASEVAKSATEAEAGARTLSEAKKKENKAKIQQTMATSNVVAAVDQALEHVNKPGVVGFGADMARKYLPGGMPPHRYDSAVATIDANTAISALQSMRESSPSGGALGNVTDFENKMLASTIANLKRSQAPEDAERALIRIKAMFLTLNEQRYDDKADPDAPAKFNKALKENIDELSVAYKNKKTTTGKSKIEKISP